MKTLIKRILPFGVILSLLFSISAKGANLNLNYSYTVENGRVDVKITGAAVSTAAVKAYKTVNTISTDTPFVYLAEQEFGADGNAEMFFIMPETESIAPSGNYTILLTQGVKSDSVTFWHMNKSQAQGSINVLHTCGKEGFVAALRNVYDDFGIDISEFNPKAADITNLIYRFADMSNIGIYDFWYTYRASVLLSYMKGQSNTVIEQQVLRNKELLKINDELFTLFDDDIESEFYGRISGGVYTQKSLENQIKEWMILSVINSSDVYTKVQNVIENNSSFIGIDLTEYNASSSKEAIIKDFMNTTTGYNSLPAAAAAFKSSVSRNKDKDGDKKPTNAGGGGGGGGGPTNVTIEDIVTEPTSKSFSDVPKEHWAYNYISKLASQGKINGVSETLFEPERNITRAEFAKLIAAQFFAGEENISSSFVDVKETDWFYAYVAKLEKNNVLQGDGNGRFNPNSYITRQDAVVMIKRAADSSGKSYTGFGSTEGFSDNEKISPYAQNAVKWACAASIINGMPDGTFAPLNLLTRAESAKLIYNLQP